MRIFTKLEYSWDGEKYVLDKSEYFDYNGDVELLCGAGSEEKSVEQQQQSIMTQMTTQAQQVFGNASSVFNALKNTFMPTIQAGPNQQGFSPAELAAMNSQIINNAGQGYRNAKAAVGNAEAAIGGGNAVLPSGVNTGVDLGLAENFANQTSEGLNQVQQENYAVGRQNYENAVKGISGAPDVFNPATNAGNSAISSGEAAAKTASDISSQNNSWISGVTGALGGIIGTATGGFMNKIPSFGGKSTANTSTNTGHGQG